MYRIIASHLERSRIESHVLTVRPVYTPCACGHSLVVQEVQPSPRANVSVKSNSFAPQPVLLIHAILGIVK